MTGSADYVAFYGLRESPFSISLDRRYLYLGHSFSSACEQMVQTLTRREGIVVLLGQSGVGKTAVCQAVIEDIIAPRHLSVIVDPLLSVEGLLRQILNDFSPGAADAEIGRGDTRHALLVRLDRFLTAIPADDLAVVLVDDAHHLSAGVLAWLHVLSNLEDERGKKLQIVLLGQPSLQTLLDRPDVHDVNQRIARRCNVMPMRNDEVERYTAYRLELGRSLNRPEQRGATPARPIEVSDRTLAPFSRAAVRTLAIVSGGVPRTINLVADRALLVGCERDDVVITPSVVRAATASLGLPVPPGARWSRRSATVAVAVATLAVVGTLGVLRVWTPRVPFSPRAPTRTAGATAATTPAQAIPATLGNTATGLTATPTPGDTIGTSSARDDVIPRGQAYVLVVASYKVEQNAESLAESLARQRFPAFVRVDPRHQWFAVVVGPYVSAEEVSELKTQLARRLKLQNTQVRVE
jgi:general secretion pathway protein A